MQEHSDEKKNTKEYKMKILSSHPTKLVLVDKQLPLIFLALGMFSSPGNESWGLLGSSKP